MIYGLMSQMQIGDSAILSGALHNVKAAHPELTFTFNGYASDLWKYNDDVSHTDLPDCIVKPPHYGTFRQEQTASRGNVVEGITMSLCEKLGIDYVPIITRVPYIPLSEKEIAESMRWNDYWLLNANHQTCSISKGYPYWQEVVDLLGGIKIIQVGGNERKDVSPNLSGVIDYRGKTRNLRDYLVMIYGCRGIISPPSGIINIGAGFGKERMVAVCGGREAPELTGYDCTYITSDRCMFSMDYPCMAQTEFKGGSSDYTCGYVRGGYCDCMSRIAPMEIASAVMRLDFSK